MHHLIRTYMGVEYRSMHFKISSRWSYVVSFPFRPFYRRERDLDMYWIGGWAGFRVDLGAVETRKISCHC
jgi:hypothetical protein